MSYQHAQTAHASGATVVRLPLTERRLSALPERPSAGCAARRARVQLQLDAGPEAAAAARAAIAMLEGCAPGELLDDARLLTSEVVTNAVRHSGAPADSAVDLEVAASPDRVRVEVADDGRGFTPRPRSAHQSQGSGWGLHLVERLASRWGVEGQPRPSVWFELERERD
ncbi:MAG: ATP-binding protein [Actinobacteria bacterium]|nr:ATP-binding protein [Actinomycetota bacterium]